MKLLRFDGLTVLALIFLPACLSPADGYRSDQKDPDVRLRELWDVYAEGRWELTGERGSSTPITDRAAYDIEKLALEYPRHAPTLFAVAAISYQEGQREKASTYLDSLLHVQPIHPEAGVLQSRISIADGNLPSAERLLRQQIRYTPDHAGLHESLAAVLFLSGERAEAKGELELASRLGAPKARIAFNMGLLSESDGQQSAAIGYYEQALAASPEFPEASSRLAGLRARAGEVVR